MSKKVCLFVCLFVFPVFFSRHLIRSYTGSWQWFWQPTYPTRCLELGWAVPHSDFLAWLSSATLKKFISFSRRLIGSYTGFWQWYWRLTYPTRCSELGWAVPHSDFLAWPSRATLRFLVAEQLYTHFCVFVCLSVLRFLYEIYLYWIEYSRIFKGIERNLISKARNRQTTNKHTDIRN